jgi:predicted nuclease of predicted toxin-antitoxin system
LGIEGVHVRSLGLEAASDNQILGLASNEEFIVVTSDNDFPEALALSGALAPSVILFGQRCLTDPARLAILLLNQMESIRDFLESGAVVVFTGPHVRVRELPI